jgi:large repetitive protein
MRDVRSSAWKLMGLRTAVVAVVAACLPALATAAPAVAPVAQAAPPTCPDGGCTVTIDATEFPSTANPTPDPLTTFNYVINLDNTKLPSDPLALSTERRSTCPTVATSCRCGR